MKRSIFIWLFLLIFSASTIPANAQTQNIIDVQPASGQAGTTIALKDVSGTNRGKTCYATFNGKATNIGTMQGSITYIVPRNAAGGSTIAFVCTGGADRLRSNTVSFTVITTAILVQPNPDSDGDGVADAQDTCPNQAGPAGSNGCPSSIVPIDSDGDGIADAQDACPRDMGTAENKGCPALLPTSAPLIVLPELPTTGPCVLATIDADFVNVRQTPSTEGTIVDALQATQIYLVIGRNGDSSWFQVETGWVAGFVTRRGGDCSALPQTDGAPNDLSIQPPQQQLGLLVPAVQNIRDAAGRMNNCPDLVSSVEALPNFIALYITSQPDPCAEAATEVQDFFFAGGQQTAEIDWVERAIDQCGPYSIETAYKFTHWMNSLQQYSPENYQRAYDALAPSNNLLCFALSSLASGQISTYFIPDDYVTEAAVAYCADSEISQAWYDHTVAVVKGLGLPLTSMRQLESGYKQIAPSGAEACTLYPYFRAFGVVPPGNPQYFQTLHDFCGTTYVYAAQRAFSDAVRSGLDAQSANNQGCAGDALLQTFPLPADQQPLLPQAANLSSDCEGNFRLLASHNASLGIETLYRIIKSLDPCSNAETFSQLGGVQIENVVPPPDCIQGNTLTIGAPTPNQNGIVLNYQSQWRDKIRVLDRPTDQICQWIDISNAGFGFTDAATPTLPVIVAQPTATLPVFVAAPTATPLGFVAQPTAVSEPPIVQPQGQDSQASNSNALGDTTQGFQETKALGIMIGTNEQGQFDGLSILLKGASSSEEEGKTAFIPLPMDQLPPLAPGYPVSLSPLGDMLVIFAQGDTTPSTKQTRQTTLIQDFSTNQPGANSLTTLQLYTFRTKFPNLVLKRGYEISFSQNFTPAAVKPVWLSDNKTLLLTLTNASGISSIYRVHLDDPNPTQIPELLVENGSAPVAAPNGRYIVFERVDANESGQMRHRFFAIVDRTNVVEPILETPAGLACYGGKFSADSLSLFFTCQEPTGVRSIYRYGLNGLSRLETGIPNSVNAVPSPVKGYITFDDGSKVYISREDGSNVQEYPIEEVNFAYSKIEWALPPSA